MVVLTRQTIDFINCIITIYFGYFFVITGLIGNIINILVFTQLKVFRKNPSAFYLTVIAIIECGQLIFAVFVRSTTAAFGNDLTRTSIVWCKLHVYIVQFGGTSSTIIICFAAIDQYISTNCHVSLRAISTFKLAQRLISILIIFTTLYCIPAVIFQEIHLTLGCTAHNSSYNYYYSFVHLCIIIGLLPIIISSLFSILAYQNVRRIVRRQIPIVRRRLDRQLTAMILVQVALYVITAIPFASARAYQANHSVDPNDPYAVSVDQLIRQVFSLIITINSASSYYIFSVTSVRYRRQVKYLFYKKIWHNLLIKTPNRNQIGIEIPRQTDRSCVSSTQVD